MYQRMSNMVCGMYPLHRHIVESLRSSIEVSHICIHCIYDANSPTPQNKRGNLR